MQQVCSVMSGTMPIGRPAQLRALLLLDRGEVGVQVKEEPLHGGSRTFRECWQESHSSRL